MVDSQRYPERDALDHLFGDSAFDSLIGGQPLQQHSVPVPVPVPLPPSDAQQYPSRRDARAAVPSRRAAAPKPSRTKSRKRSGSTRQTPPPAFVKPADSAYPVERVIVVRRAAPVKKKKRGSGFLTILAVAGLFGSVALPAYALNPFPPADANLAAVATTDDVALSVNDDAVTLETVRGEFGATTGAELRNQRRTTLMADNFSAYMASGAREMGDDYPWFSELAVNQGGGLSPLNYFYRQCVDFVAWRLNRDAGTTSAPYAWTWSNLTSSGGNASQWRYAWTSKGWPTSTTPVVGAVAWFPYNHVAYVKAVNADGTVLLEEYNWEGKSLYGQRTIPASGVTLYLYPPPR